ncbi:ABC transporter permease [Falsiroseomonas sp.]|uniref:ABC transporter permease n=1 Tax=Falsiroseomonas sp. TaxID=2870721 RepID=UPI003F6E7EC1
MQAAFRRYARSIAALVGLVLLLGVIGMAASADWLFPEDPLSLAGAPLTPPFTEEGLPLGTDSVGRDIAAQIFHGARVSLLVGLVATGIAIGVGIVVGAISGYFGGHVDAALMRVTEAFQTVPSFILLLMLVVIFGSEITTLALAIGAVSWTAPARLTRAEFLTLRMRDFVLSCRTLGMAHARIIFREILPSALPPVIVYVSVVMAIAILNESALAFLGLSDPNIASWGNLIGDGRRVLRGAWYVAALPGLAIIVTVLAISLVGQGVNDLLNPRLGRR